MKALANENCAGAYSRNNAMLGQDLGSEPCSLGPRFAFIVIAKRRVIWRLSVVLRVTRRRLTVFGLGLLLLWTLQTYLAVSQHKHELLNTRGPLYVLFVR